MENKKIYSFFEKASFAIEACRLLIRKDELKECPFCRKKEWGKDKHEKTCPFYLAYIVTGDI